MPQAYLKRDMITEKQRALRERDEYRVIAITASIMALVFAGLFANEATTHRAANAYYAQTNR